MTSSSINYSSKPPPPAESASPPWLRYVAMLTGVLAGLGGFITVKGAGFSNEAIYHSTQAVLHQATATDAWSEYQADSIKARIVETQMATSGSDEAVRAKLEPVAKDLRDRQPRIKARAEKMEENRDAEMQISNKKSRQKGILDYGGMFVQLGIALASVAALTRRKSAFAGGVVAAAVGAGFTGYVLVQHYFAK